MYSIPKKIHNLFDQLQQSIYNGNIDSHHHFSIAIRNNMAVSPVLCNYSRAYVFGKIRGTMHSEMSTLNYILNNDKSSCRNTNHRCNYFGEEYKGIYFKEVL